MSFREVCAVLVGEPYCLSMEQIAKLTDYQLYGIYCYPRDDHGRPLPSHPDPAEVEGPVTFEQAFRHGLRQKGYDEAGIEREWQRHQQAVKDLQKAEGEG